MAISFHAEPDPSETSLAALSGWAPCNPFYTPAYAAARRAGGDQPWAIVLRDGDQIVAGCSGFLATRKAGRRLIIPSLPHVPADHDFWALLLEAAGTAKVERLVLNSFGSEGAEIPALAERLERQARREFHLDLRADDPFAGLSSNHRRNIRRAGKAGVTVAPSDSPDAALEHARLMGSSMTRRSERGEAVATAIDSDSFLRYLSSGAARLYQARLEDQLLSSILVLLAPRGGYYHSAGTSPAGMKQGASHFLVHQVAGLLRDQGFWRFNLSGARPDEEGLTRFKAGFGAQPVDLETAQIKLADSWRSRIGAGLKAIGLRSGGTA